LTPAENSSRGAPGAFVVVDWGTSSFRGWLMSADGETLAESRGGEGMLHCTGGGAGAGFAPVLRDHLARLGAPEGVPVLICGMAGARQGWAEAPYLKTPTRLDALHEGAIRIDAPGDMPLLWALRDILGLTGTKFGCGIAQCGACTVHVDGEPTRSCVTPLSAVGQAKIVTLAGLGTPEKPHPLQTAYVEEQVPQCGYCINGWLMTAAAFLRDNKKPSEAEIKEALSGLKCRCGTHISILKAVKRAAEMMG